MTEEVVSTLPLSKDTTLAELVRKMGEEFFGAELSYSLLRR